MVLASEILARAFENSSGPQPEVASADVVAQFLRLDKELGLMKLLRGLNAADSAVSANRNVILVFSEKSGLEIKTYRDATEALRALFELEQKNIGNDLVLVRADTSEEVRIAFKNYFSDARDFIQLIEEGCRKLSGKMVILASDLKNIHYEAALKSKDVISDKLREFVNSQIQIVKTKGPRKKQPPAGYKWMTG